MDSTNLANHPSGPFANGHSTRSMPMSFPCRHIASSFGDKGRTAIIVMAGANSEEIDRYEKVRRGEFPVINRLTQLGQLLIALRIANGITQHELAERLGVNESVVSRDERNEYHGITVERAQRVLNALDGHVIVRLETSCPSDHEELREAS